MLQIKQGVRVVRVYRYVFKNIIAITYHILSVLAWLNEQPGYALKKRNSENNTYIPRQPVHFIY